MTPSAVLGAVRLIHTIAWVLLASCVVAIPGLALSRHFGLALGLSAVVLAEVGVLALNQWRCPLTAIAARYTDDRRANFDIYLPEWLARNNKVIFGALYVVGLLFLLGRWGNWF